MEINMTLKKGPSRYVIFLTANFDEMVACAEWFLQYMIWLPQVNFSGVETYEVVSGDTFCGNYAVQIIYLLYMQIASIWIMGFNTQILGHIF